MMKRRGFLGLMGAILTAPCVPTSETPSPLMPPMPMLTPNEAPDQYIDVTDLTDSGLYVRSISLRRKSAR